MDTTIYEEAGINVQYTLRVTDVEYRTNKRKTIEKTTNFPVGPV